MPRSVTVSAEALRIIRQWIADQGGVVKAARALGLDSSYVSRVASGKRPPHPKLLRRVGLVRSVVVSYRLVRS